MKQILFAALLLLLCIAMFNNEMIFSKNNSSLPTHKNVSAINRTSRRALPSLPKKTNETIGMTQLLFFNFPE